MTTPLVPGKYDDTNASLVYTGPKWYRWNGSGPYNNTFTYSETIGNRVETTFTGTGVKLNYAGNYDRGIIQVAIDGIVVGSVNTYSSAVTWQNVWTSPSVSLGTHSLVLTHSSGVYIDIDAITVLNIVPPFIPGVMMF